MERNEEAPLELLRVTLENLSTVQTLVRSIFPVSYSENFYRECLENDLVGAVFRRGEAIAIVAVKPENYESGPVLYIRSFGVHPLYRESGLGSFLMSFVEQKCRALNLPNAMLHVQTNNKTAIQFYQKRGFTIENLIPRYYQRCDPPDAYVMRKTFR